MTSSRFAAASLALALALGASEATAQIGPRIVNGVTTQAHATTGALLVKNGNFRGQVCSGTLVGCQTFVTAAHCVCNGSTFSTCGLPDPQDYAVYLQNVGLIDVAAIAVEPSYDFAEEGDIAVLMLAAPATGVPPTPINTTATPGFGASATIVGFGITEGNAHDSGVKRAGSVTTGSCAGTVPESEHVCWSFTNPLGAPGEDSNTCSGDSGGPLFVDFGSGEVLAGVTSGGTVGGCHPPDFSFDTNVFANRLFIQGVAGGDLGATSCGSHSQVGDLDTEEVRTESVLLRETDASVRACRKEVAKRYRTYAATALKARQACLDRVDGGSAPGPCPDATAASTLAGAVAKVDPGKLAKKCTAAVVPDIGGAGACAEAENAADLASCIVSAADGVIADLLATEYAEPSPSSPLAGDEAACQAKIASTMHGYAQQRLALLTKCQARQDTGKTGSCPDLASQARLQQAAAKVLPSIEKKCSNALVASLDQAGAFGGSCDGSTTTAGLASCQIAEHDAHLASLLGLLADAQTSETSSFSVPSGSDRFRVTLNGAEDGSNDLDIYVKHGAPPTTSDYDVRSNLAGMFDSVEVPSPASGTWYVLVDLFSGENIRYQLTITRFEP